MTLTARLFKLDPQELRARAGYEPLRPGVDLLILQEDAFTGSAVGVLRYAPGAEVPAHEHLGYEYLIVLEGEQSDESGTYSAGSLVINAPGTRHSVMSKTGCLLLAIWERPVRFVAPPDEPLGS
jgi:anti-sigma factor ChrR (cupin superfamily)